jgi:hypothetical protein
MPEEKDKKELTPEEKEKALTDAFNLDKYASSPIPRAVDRIIEPFDDEDQAKLTTGQPELNEALVVRGKMLGPQQGMKPRQPLEKHAAPIGADASLDDVPPMLRAKVLADRAKAAEGK